MLQISVKNIEHLFRKNFLTKSEPSPQTMSEEETAAANPSLRDARFKKPANSTAIQRICRIYWPGLIRDVGSKERYGKSIVLRRGYRRGGGESLDQPGYELLCLRARTSLGHIWVRYDGTRGRIVARSKSELPPWKRTKSPRSWLTRGVKDLRWSTSRWIEKLVMSLVEMYASRKREKSKKRKITRTRKTGYISALLP